MRYWLAALPLLLCAVAGSAVAAQGSQPENSSGAYVLLADTGGPVTQAVISVNSARRAALRNVELISNIVNGLATDTRFGILTNDLAAFTVASNPWPERIEFIEMPVDNAITIWTQDPFLVLHDATNQVRLLTPREFDRAGDQAMAAVVADTYGYETVASKLFFEGGNIVSDERHVFIGANTIQYNASRWMLSEDAIVTLFEQELGRRVLVVGPAPQPIGHIDMMLTPLGQGRVALADTAAGAAAVRQQLQDKPEQVAAFEQTTMDTFFGAPGIDRLTMAAGRTLEAPDLVGQTAAMVEASEQLAPVLDTIATGLAEFGYEVRRVPMLYGGPGSGSADAEMAATYPMLTYNNVLLEQDANTRVAYIPRYGLAALDTAAAEAWQQLGFKVRPVDDLTISAMYGGALRCSVKILERR